MAQRKSNVTFGLVAAVVGMMLTAQAAKAETLTAVVDSISSFGNTMGNQTARPVENKSVGLILVVSGKVYQQEQKSAKVTEVGDLKQLSIVLPNKVGDRTNAEDLCIRRAEALMSGENSKARLEVAFDGARIGQGHYKANKVLGCSDLRVQLAVKPKPTPKPKPTATPRPAVTPKPATTK